MDARSKIDIIYQDGLADLRAVLDRASEVQASIDKSANDAAEKMNAQTGALISTAQDLNASADILVEKKLRELHEVINQVAETTVEKAIREALGRHVTNEAIKLKGEISLIASELRGTLSEAKGAQTKAAIFGGLVGAVLVMLFTWATTSYWGSATADNSAPVTRTASNVKQVPRNR